MRDFHYHICFSILLIFKNIMLVYSVLRFRHFVKTFQFAVPKRRLMVLHFINVFIYSTLYIVSAVLYINYVKTKQNDTTLAA